jgi:HlyD family secretion protein
VSMTTQAMTVPGVSVAADLGPDLTAHPRTARTIAAGLLTIALGIGGFTAWAATAPLASAALAPGVIGVESNRKTVQHLQGGIIAELLVREGERVRAGQVLVRLDDVETQAQFEMLDTQHAALLAEEARLLARRDDQPKLVFPGTLTARSGEPKVAEILFGQRQIFDRERTALNGQIDILHQRIAQHEAQIAACEAQIVSTSDQLALIQEELAVVLELVAKGLEKRPRLLLLQRTAAGLTGTLADFQGRIAAARQAIGEAEFEIASLRQDDMREVATTLREVQSKRAEIAEKLGAAASRQSRQDIPSPADGTVLNLQYFAPGAVVKPGGAIMDIVPGDDQLVVDARVQSNDIDVVHADLPAEVVLTAYKSRTTPRLKGTVTRVSADALIDEKTNLPYFKAQVQIAPQELVKVPEIHLAPGMPAEVFIVTGERTALDYLIQPLRDSFHRAFREQ